MEGLKSLSAADIEQVIRSLTSVTSVRVVMSEKGIIEEIHVLTDANRTPKQVVRDVESALMAQFGLELDHKKVSVAQTQSHQPFHFNENRLRFSGVSISMNGDKTEATVNLKTNGVVHTGIASGHSSSHNQLRLVATATLRAVEDCHGSDGSLVLEDINPSISFSGRNVAVVFVNMITSQGEDFLSGSAVVKQDVWKAVVNATLNAVNRRLGVNGEG